MVKRTNGPSKKSVQAKRQGIAPRAKKPSGMESGWTSERSASGQRVLTPRELACLDIVGEDEQLMFADGHDEAIIGVAERDGEWIVVYDTEKIIRGLKRRDGMTRDEAEEFFAFNIEQAWHGPATPIFISLLQGAKV